MQQIESFVWLHGDIKIVTDQVNKKIKELKQSGINEIKIEITPTTYGVVYTLIYR